MVMPLGTVYITSCLSGNGNGHAYITEKGSRRGGSGSVISTVAQRFLYTHIRLKMMIQTGPAVWPVITGASAASSY